MNQKYYSILSTAQQNKLHQLQSEIEVLERQIDSILKEQRLNNHDDSPIYLSDRFTQTGIRLADAEG